MGRQNQQRRAAKRRAEARRASQVQAPRPGAGPGEARRQRLSLRDLVGAAAMATVAGAGEEAEAFVAELADRHRCDPVAVGDEIAAGLLHGVAGAWERGWQPADLVHVARRRGGRHGGVVSAVAVVLESASYRGHPAADATWLAQVEAVAPDAPGRGGPFAQMAAATGGAVEAIGGAVAVLGLLHVLPDQPRLVEPPSAWGRGPARSPQAVGDPKVAARVRALLAKAESTEFEEEAETFTVKAQELIAKHAIDQAMLEGEQGGGEVAGRRVLLDDPYLKAKAMLLAAVAQANRCRTVINPELGFSTVFGYPGDLDAVELLFSSLLTQATGSMVVASRRAGSGRVRSFRQAFLIAFAERIGQRLRLTADGVVAGARAVHGEALLPVLIRRDEQVEAARDAAFGRLVRSRVSVSNHAGYAAGRAAADLADLGLAGRLKAG